MGRVERAEVVKAVGLGACVALQGGGFGPEGGSALLQQRHQRALDDEVDERLGRVEAAAVLARVAVGAHHDLAFRAAHRFPFQQAFVDGAELLHGHVAVVDVAPAAFACGVAEVVDDGGERGVGQARLFEHGRGASGKEAAVVGRQTDGGVAPVDLAAERGDVVVVAAGEGGKDVAGRHAFVDVVAHGFAQAVVVVAVVVDGQQVAVLGVEEEEQTVEEDERGLADVRQLRAALCGQGADQGGVDFIEDGAGQIVCDLLFVAPAFGEGVLEKAGLRALLRAERGPAEEQAEGAQGVEAVVRLESGFEVDFAITAGAGERAAVIETPDAAVGEDAPADAPVRVDVGGGQVAQDLAVRRAGLFSFAGVEGQVEALALGDGEGVGIALRRGFGRGAVLGRGIAEEQVVGDVFVVVAALLGQVVGPAEQLEEGADELLLGGGLVDGVEVGGLFEEGERLGAEGVEVGGLGQGVLPGAGVADAFFEKVAGEQVTGHWLVAVDGRFGGSVPARYVIAAVLKSSTSISRARSLACHRS